MKCIQKLNILLFVFTLLIWLTIPLTAQLKRTGLIFSEVYLNKKEPNKSWLEIYNPTNASLTLEKFRFSNILTHNILPEEIQEKGGIEILPGKCIVLCADVSKFNFIADKNLELIQINDIKRFGSGGYFSLDTKGLGENGEDIFRYGRPDKTAHLYSQ